MIQDSASCIGLHDQVQPHEAICSFSGPGARYLSAQFSSEIGEELPPYCTSGSFCWGDQSLVPCSILRPPTTTTARQGTDC